MSGGFFRYLSYLNTDPVFLLVLRQETSSAINKKIKTGMYTSASEVIREGLRLLKERDELRDLRLKELKKDIQKGYDSASNGNVAEWNLDQFRKQVRSRTSNGKKSRS